MIKSDLLQKTSVSFYRLAVCLLVYSLLRTESRKRLNRSPGDQNTSEISSPIMNPNSANRLSGGNVSRIARPALLAVAAAAGLLPMEAGAAEEVKSPKKPNILFVISDDQRWDTIQALGNDKIITPNLDRLVKRGVSFSNAYMMGGACMPSRASILSGRNTFKLTNFGRVIPESDVSLPETLRDAGYETALSGKQHNGRGLVTRSFEKGWNFHFDSHGILLLQAASGSQRW